MKCGKKQAQVHKGMPMLCKAYIKLHPMHKYRIAHLGLLHKVLVYQRIIELSRTDGHSWNQAAKENIELRLHISFYCC